MVKLNAKQVHNDGKQITPVMFVHPLKSDHFKTDSVVNCYITEMSDERYAVFSSGYDHDFYKVVPSLIVLHDEFNEV